MLTVTPQDHYTKQDSTMQLLNPIALLHRTHYTDVLCICIDMASVKPWFSDSPFTYSGMGPANALSALDPLIVLPDGRVESLREWREKGRREGGQRREGGRKREEGGGRKDEGTERGKREEGGRGREREERGRRKG